MTTVSIGEWMNCDEAMVEPDAKRVFDFASRIDPRTRIKHKIANRLGNLRWLDADVRLAPTVHACPSPHVTEHGSVQVAKVLIVEEDLDARCTTARECAQDVLLLGLVKVASRCDVAQLETQHVVIAKWRVPFSIGKQRIEGTHLFTRHQGWIATVPESR